MLLCRFELGSNQRALARRDSHRTDAVRPPACLRLAEVGPLSRRSVGARRSRAVRPPHGTPMIVGATAMLLGPLMDRSNQRARRPRQDSHGTNAMRSPTRWGSRTWEPLSCRIGGVGRSPTVRPPQGTPMNVRAPAVLLLKFEPSRIWGPTRGESTPAHLNLSLLPFPKESLLNPCTRIGRKGEFRGGGPGMLGFEGPWNKRFGG